MSSATAVQSNQNDIVPPSVDEVCQNILAACANASRTGDFLSAVTMIEFYIGNPRQFSDEEGVLVLETLYKALAAYPPVVYEMGWDLPELLLRYVDRYFEPDVITLPSQKPFRLVMSLFSLVCEKGNPRELFVRACELILSTESEKNRLKLQRLSLNGPEDAVDDEHKGKGIDIDMPADIFESLDDTRQENVKFCTLFEVMRYSLQHIDTAHPAGYLLEATRTMLQAADDPNVDLLSVTTYARRMYLLARDFLIPNEELVSADELDQVRKILCNFLSHAVDTLLSKYSLKFSERLFVQMKNRVAMAPPSDREFVYKESDYTRRIYEAISRMSQLLLSFDYDPEAEVQRWLGLVCDDDGQCAVSDKKLPPTSAITNWPHKETNKWANELISGPSYSGLLIIKTIIHFDSNREKKPNWKAAAHFSIPVLSRLTMTAGLKDIALYWALWLSNHSEKFVFDDDDLLTRYLHNILNMISTSHSPQEKYVTGSIVARFLRFQTRAFSYNFCIDIMKNSDNSYQHFVVVECLKMLITGKIGGAHKDDKSDQESVHRAVDAGPMVLSAEQIHEISEVSRNAIIRIFQHSCSIPWYYLNFLSVVPTDPIVILQLCEQLDSLTASCRTRTVSDSCRVQIELIKNAVAVLRSKSQHSLSSN